MRTLGDHVRTESKGLPFIAIAALGVSEPPHRRVLVRLTFAAGRVKPAPMTLAAVSSNLLPGNNVVSRRSEIVQADEDEEQVLGKPAANRALHLLVHQPAWLGTLTRLDLDSYRAGGVGISRENVNASRVPQRDRGDVAAAG